MQRRDFLKANAMGALGMGLPKPPTRPFYHDGKTTDRFISAYYFRAHMYTLVPSQVREDMRWMADIGTNVVSVAVLEQDLFAAVENLGIICEEADRVGMKVFAVPSRWGGLVAGAPKVPSLHTARNYPSWQRNKDGTPRLSSVSGVFSSIYHESTLDFFKESSAKMFELWPLAGLVWDEIKIMRSLDYCDAALTYHGGKPQLPKHQQKVAEFFSDINAHIKEFNPAAKTSAFIYANSKDDAIQTMVEIKNLDYAGLDGRPWSSADGGVNESNGKVIIGQASRFLEATSQKGLKSLVLIENHNMKAEDTAMMDKRLPEVLDLPFDQVMYYYYPRNISNPEENMGIIGKHIKAFAKEL